MLHLLHKQKQRSKQMEMLHVRLKQDLHRLLKAYCASKGLSITFVVGDIIQKYLSSEITIED